ncbi:MAG: hypothetical protein LKI42_06455 [Bacteroidales bacterium]|jgi:hypothetical protein|nr:hypothetical protein [Bacteroidales bacterium]MCI1786305.1 hypothetical protein [Bacteroidales bacterium]
MKKILLFFSLFGVLSAYAGNGRSDDGMKPMSFYGIDFSMVKVSGASESGREFMEAFGGINGLFLSEPDKYIVPLEKRLSVQFSRVSLDAVFDRNAKIDPSELHASGRGSFTEDLLQSEIDRLDVSGDGIGLVVVACELDKGTDIGTYYYVFFRESDKKILKYWEKRGASGGIGLRNYWARSFYRTIKSINPSDLDIRLGIARSSVTSAVKQAASGLSEALDKIAQ